MTIGSSGSGAKGTEVVSSVGAGAGSADGLPTMLAGWENTGVPTVERNALLPRSPSLSLDLDRDRFRIGCVKPFATSRRAMLGFRSSSSKSPNNASGFGV